MKKILAVLIAAMLVLMAFAGCSSEKTEEGSAVALKIGNSEFSVSDMDYMYVSTFYEMYNNLYYTYYYNYGMDISAILDISQPLEDQMMSEDTSWHQFVLEQTVANLIEMEGIYQKAKESGFVLSEDQQAGIDTLEEQLDEIAAENGVEPDEYLDMMYGERVDLETIKKMTEMQIVVNAFATDYQSKIEVTEEDIDAYYQTNKQTIDTVDFRYYYSFYSDEEDSLTREEAEAQANAIAEVHTADEFNALAYEYTTDEEQKALYEDSDATLFPGAGYDSIGIEEVCTWLFDEARQQGDTMVYHDESNSAYLTVMFEERIDPDYDFVDVRHILIAPEEDEEGNISDEAWATAETKATEVLDSYLAGEMTEEAFSALAAEHSADGNAAQGGIYEDVYKGQMVTEFEDWCFDETRTAGDTGIVKTRFGYHIMYFVGLGENNLVSLIEPVIEEERLAAWVAECSLGLTEEKTEAFENVGGMIDDIVAASNESAEDETESETNVGISSGVIIAVLVAVIIVCIIVIIKNAKADKKLEPMAEAEETEESVFEATDEDLSEKEILDEEAFEETVSEETEE